MNPPVYLLDEPSSSLDEETALAIFDTLTEWVHDRDSTLIMVTHSSQVARKYGDVIVHIRAGQLESVEVRDSE